MQFKKVKKEIINCKKRDFAQTCRFYAKNGVFLQIERNVVQKVNRDAQVLINFKIYLSFLSPDVSFKRKFSKKSIKIKSKFVLYGRFTLHHLQDHFSNFLLNFSSLAKNAKREIWRQKRDLRCKICNCIKCLALYLGHAGSPTERYTPNCFTFEVTTKPSA